MMNLTPIDHKTVSATSRADRNGHAGAVFWLTGLSGSGKSTLAIAAEHRLHEDGKQVYILDGDNLRTGLCSDLGFSLLDRQENIRRVAEVAKLFRTAGFIVLCSFVSPTRLIRAKAKEIIGAAEFHEIHVDASLSTCESRDVKGLYAKARRGDLPGFTGVDSPYEPPTLPDLVLPSGSEGVEVCTARLVDYIIEKTAISPTVSS